MVDPTITIGNILEVSAIVGGGFWFLIKSGNKLTILANDVNYLKAKMNSVSDLLTSRAVIETRLAAAEQDIRELRHGDGFIRNVRPSKPGINKEYT